MPARTMPARREAAPKQETSTQPAKPTQPSDRRVDELLIRFRTGVTPQEQEAVLQWTGAQRQRLRGTSGVERLTFPAEQNVDTIAASLSNNPAVELVEPNYLIAADEVTPNDPRFNEQWALKKTGQTGGTTGGDLGVTEAWAQTTGSPATLIAVIDSGIDFTHPDLRSNRWTNTIEKANSQDDDRNGFTDDLHGWDFIANTNSNTDEQGHGTGVAGLIAAHGNNGKGISGVMWRATLIDLRVLDGSGTGDVASAVEAIDYAVAQGAQVINCSWGLEHESQALRDAISRAASREVVFVCAAGNSGHDLAVAPHYPAAYELPNVLAVAATDESGLLAQGSNSGGKNAAILAPGVNLLTTKPNNSYEKVSGTSTAAALVSGVVGLIKTLRPFLSAARVREMLAQGGSATVNGQATTAVNASSTITATNNLPPDEGLPNNNSQPRVVGGFGNGHDNPQHRVTPFYEVEDLPDLQRLRSQPHHEPHAPKQVPSQMRRHRSNIGGNSNSQVSRGDSGVVMLVPATGNDKSTGDDILLARYADSPARTLVAANLPTEGTDYLGLGLLNQRGGAASLSISDAPTHIPWASPSLNRLQSAAPTEIRLQPAQTIDEIISGLHTYSRLMVNDMLAAVSGNDATFVSQSVPTTLVAGQQYTVTVQMQNTGATTWTAANSYRLGAQSPQDNTTWNNGRVNLANSAAPNEIATFTFTITAPVTPGAYAFQWRMVQDGVEWFGQYSPLTYINVISNAHFVSHSVPSIMQIGHTYSVSVTMQNIGRTAWPAVVPAGQQPQYRLGSRNTQDNSVWGTGRVNLPYDVPASGNVTFSFNVTAPATPGVYNFQWQMLDEGYVWFGELTQNLAINVTADGTYTPPAAGNAIISEFRLRGPAGPADEFIELYNNTSMPLTVSTQDNTAGWTLAKVAADGTTSVVCVIPAGTVIPARGHYLIANATGYSLTGYATPDLTYTTSANQDIADNTGIALFRTADTNNLNSTTRLDAVGFAAVSNNPYVEGTGLSSVSTSMQTTDGQFSFARTLVTGTPQDTNNNAGDFVLVSTTGCVGTVSGSPPACNGMAAVLGAPAPEGLSSAIQYNTTITASSVDPYVCSTCGINRVRDTTPNVCNNGNAPSNCTAGTLTIRRKFTNSTGSPVTHLRFRVADITTKNTPGTGLADVRLLSSGDVTVYDSQSHQVQVRGTTVDDPPTQTSGGGLNSSAVAGAITLGSPLAAGDSINVQFVLGIVQGGTFRFFTNVEAVLGSATGQPSAPPTMDDFAAARVLPANRTGGSGVDLRSGNYNWSLPLVSLPGRAGLDLGLALVYNSRVWTRSGNYIMFDADQGFPSPGFRLGFPVIQPKYYNSATQQYSYLLITPNGDHVELRQTATAGVYEAADSSHLQATETIGGLILRPTDGSQLTYWWMNGQYQCTKIEDRNGNLITATYDGLEQPPYYGIGQLQTVKDTLGRIITFNYDSYDNLISITQQWQGQTHVWATFGWGTQTIQTNFQDTINGQQVNLTMVGIENGSTIPVLNQVGLADGSLYRFDYTAWGQVNRITRYTLTSDTPPANPSFPTDYTARSYVGHFLYFDNAGHSDCPPALSENVQAQYWNAGAEAVTSYSVPQPTTWTMPDNTTQSGIMSQVTTPDGTSYKTYMHSSGWDDGLPLLVETWSGGVKQRWVTTAWTQDDTTKTFPINPRDTETNIYDASGNQKRTTTSYYDAASFNLPQDITEYAAPPNTTTVLRRTHLSYNLASAYVNQRIIGLPSEQDVLDGNGTYVSKVDYQYDLPNDQTIYLQDAGATTQHDDANYGINSTLVRGNLSMVRRYDTTNTTTLGDTSLAHASKIGYDTNGSVRLAVDPKGDRTTIGYTDNFSVAANNGNKFAYPTVVTVYDSPTDQTGFSATTQYNYDFGAVTQRQTPLPNTQTYTPGPLVYLSYDAAGRLTSTTNSFDQGQTQAIYPASLMTVQTLTRTQANVPDASAVQVFDGVGRVRATSRDMMAKVNNVDTLHHSAQKFVFDQMGRLVNQSNPTEVTDSWVPTGTDTTWYYTAQAYDWKGRPTDTTNTDGTQKHTFYGGCGCAGGEVVTMTDENGRQQVVTHDVLGRVIETKTLNWDGTPYATVTTGYSVLDQVTGVTQTQNSDNTSQATTMTYDGYGRLSTQHRPEQDAGQSTRYTYDNPDDMVKTMTDGRGSVTTYTYNGRHLVTNIQYTASAGVTDTPSVSYAYDAAGNRTQMTDGLGTVSYHYNQLSRLDSETRAFNDPGPPYLHASYTLTYGYNLAGALLSVNNQAVPSDSFSFSYDQSGQLTMVGASGYNLTQYASGFEYRAWGAPKHITYGNNLTLDLGYNERMQVMDFTIPNVLSKHYEYSGQGYYRHNPPQTGDDQYVNDGTVKFSHDLLDSRLDRAYYYDQVNRLGAGLTGKEAGPNTTSYGPYYETFGYDAMDHMSSRSWRSWQQTQYGTFPSTQSSGGSYANNRRTATGWTYDADGNLTASVDGGTTFQYAYNSAGQLINSSQTGRVLQQAYDGDGHRVKFAENSTPTYYLRSTALGGRVLTEFNGSGQKLRGYVYAAGELVAKQEGGQVLWEHRDGSNTTTRETNQTGQVTSKVELDPLGVTVDDQWSQYSSGATYNYNPIGFYGTPRLPDMGCSENGVPADCEQVVRDVNNGVAGVDSIYLMPGVHTSTSVLTATSFIFAPGWGQDTYTDGGDNADGTVGFSMTVTATMTGTFVATGTNSLPSQITTNPRGAGGGVGPTLNTGPLAHFDSKRFNKCLQDFFGIIPGKDSPNFDRKRGGYFIGFANGELGRSYWVATDVSRKNSYTLAQDLNRANNLQIGKRWATQSGLTIWDDIKERTGVNFIASDVASDPSKYVDIGVFGDYIHELGNALGAETGMDDPFGDYAAENAKSGINDPDVGAAFERCVFGGLVGLRSGRVGTSREF